MRPTWLHPDRMCVGAVSAAAVVMSTVVCLLPVLHAAGRILSRSMLPQRNRETSQQLLHHEGPKRAMTNSTLLGAGFTSRLRTWVWHWIPLTAFLLGSPAAGATVLGTYGPPAWPVQAF